jgi:hypothetical protein
MGRRLNPKHILDRLRAAHRHAYRKFRWEKAERSQYSRL